MCGLLSQFLAEKKLRRTEERFTILERICAFPGHFDIDMLYHDLEQANFHVSRATIYNTLDVLLEAGLIVRHQWMTKSAVQYELKIHADTHMHLICTRCGVVREIRNSSLNESLGALKIARFTPESYCLYVYGICSKCKYKMRMR